MKITCKACGDSLNLVTGGCPNCGYAEDSVPVPPVVVNVADLIDPETGKSYREKHAAMCHEIPIGALVEINSERNSWGELPDGVRLYVVGYTRDCDQTPLYTLAARFLDARWFRSESFVQRLCARVINGYDEDSLTVVSLPPTEHENCPGCGVPRPVGSSCEWCEQDRRCKESAEWPYIPIY